MNLYGKILYEPQLRFNYSSTYAVHTVPKKGLIRFGPYDSGQYNKDCIKSIILYSKGTEEAKNILKNELTQGAGNYKGFQELFRISLRCEDEVEFEENRIERTLQEVVRKDVDIIFILIKTGKKIRASSNVYKTVKKMLLGNGIPSQVVISEKIDRRYGRDWMLENIALATYAKTGGTPWVVANPLQENQLILGVSRAKDISNYLVGFITLFTQDGDFILMHSKAPVIQWEDYIKGLKGLIIDAVEEFIKLEGEPSSIIVHFHKRPGEKEISAIEDALKNLNKDIPYALIHINEYSNFRLFDTGHPGYVPLKGLKVDLSRHEALLLTDGRLDGRRQKMGVPRVLDIVMDKRSTLSVEKFPHLVKQIYDFAHVNWRGFNASAIPITLNYSKLIARMIIEIGAKNWNQIIASGKLRDKAWFL
jgi:vacuolar-type H+-ATPase subunit F/Vma7